MVAKLGHLKKG